MFLFLIYDESAAVQKLNPHAFDLGIKPAEL